MRACRSKNTEFPPPFRDVKGYDGLQLHVTFILISIVRDKKLCRCRGTARRATNTNIALEKVCNRRMTFNDTQVYYNCCYQIGSIRDYTAIVACCQNISIEHRMRDITTFWCMWLPVTLRSRSPLTIKFKSQVTCAFNLWAITLQLKQATFLELWVLQMFKNENSKSDFHPHWRSLSIVPFDKP